MAGALIPSLPSSHDFFLLPLDGFVTVAQAFETEEYALLGGLIEVSLIFISTKRI